MLHRGHSALPNPSLDAPGLLGALDGPAIVRPPARPAGRAGTPPSFDRPEITGDGAGGLPDTRVGAELGGAEMGVIPADRSEALNRAVNVIIAGFALLLLAPVCVVVAFCIKLTSPGPVFYTQTRVGLDRRWRRRGVGPAGERRTEDLGGQPFTILKFRSMRVDAEANGQAVWATKHDARITPIGQVMRKTRLDEIPQLINVLRGEMNIVGPRPERPSIVLRLCEHVAEYPQRHRVKPGITGWAQINHSYDSSIEDVRTKVRYDLEYIGRQGLWFDVKIMCLTLPVMLFKRGAH